MRYCLLITLSFLTMSTDGVAGTIHVFPTSSPIREKVKDYAFEHLTTEQFLSLRPKDIRSISGKRVTLKERIVLKIVQQKIRKALKQETEINLSSAHAEADRNFNVGGFLLGFFFSLVGVLIAILFGGNAVRSALLGALCGFLVALIAVLL